jgi:Holliday junction resolvasome RuvABC DNA-binding subunit
MAVRIQLASNFQVVELTYDDWSEVNYHEVSLATEMVNRLGGEVVNDIKSNKKEEQKNEEMATEGQIKFLKSLGVNEDDAKKMTKKEAWKYLKDNK